MHGAHRVGLALVGIVAPVQPSRRGVQAGSGGEQLGVHLAQLHPYGLRFGKIWTLTDVAGQEIKSPLGRPQVIGGVSAGEGALVISDPPAWGPHHVAIGHEHLVELHAARDGGPHAKHLPVIQQLDALPVHLHYREHHPARIRRVTLHGAPNHQVLGGGSHRGKPLTGRQPVATFDPGQFGFQNLGAVLVQVCLRTQRGAEGSTGDVGQEPVALFRRGMESDDACRVIVHLKQLGSVGLPAGHSLQHLVPGAEPAG